MGIFGRKKQEEDYDKEVEERLPSRKKFRDLYPENRKRRKEPPKPWGKRERLLVLFVFLGTIITSGILAASARDWKLPGVPRVTLPTVKNEPIIIDRVIAKDREKAQKVITKFKDTTKSLSGVYGLYVIDLESGFSYGISENEIFEAASLSKLPVIAALYREAESGGLNLETKYTLKEGDKIAGSGSLYGKPAGTIITYRELARLMGKQSDNTAFGIIRRILGDQNIEEVIKKIGMQATSLAKNETTPSDMGAFFEALWKSELVSEKSRDEILGYLTDTIYEDWIVKGIPEDVRVAHKYGRELHVVNDAGIAFTDKPFILVIMSKGIVEKEADAIFPELARIVYDVQTEN